MKQNAGVDVALFWGSDLAVTNLTGGTITLSEKVASKVLGGESYFSNSLKLGLSLIHIYNKRAGERLCYIGGTMTIQEIKALPRTEEGIFDLAAVQQSAGLGNIYQAADLVYPVYAAYETTENKKEGYPDIMAQMRVLKKHAESEFSAENGAAYTAVMLHTVAVSYTHLFMRMMKRRNGTSP